MIEPTGRCRACGTVRPLVDLLEVRRHDRPDVVTFVCRPARFPWCFGRTIEPAFVESIRLADPAGVASSSARRSAEERREADLVAFNCDRSETHPRSRWSR